MCLLGLCSHEYVMLHRIHSMWCEIDWGGIFPIYSKTFLRIMLISDVVFVSLDLNWIPCRAQKPALISVTLFFLLMTMKIITVLWPNNFSVADHSNFVVCIRPPLFLQWYQRLYNPISTTNKSPYHLARACRFTVLWKSICQLSDFLFSCIFVKLTCLKF